MQAQRKIYFDTKWLDFMSSFALIRKQRIAILATDYYLWPVLTLDCSFIVQIIMIRDDKGRGSDAVMANGGLEILYKHLYFYKEGFASFNL